MSEMQHGEPEGVSPSGGERSGFTAAQALERAAELIGAGESGDERVGLPATGEEFVIMFGMALALQREEILAYSRVQESHPYRLPLQIRANAQREIMRLAGEDSAAQSKLTADLMEHLIRDQEGDPELQNVIWKNLLDAEHHGEQSLFNNLGFVDGARVVERSLQVDNRSVGVSVGLIDELDRRIGLEPERAERELTEYTLAADGRQAFTVLRSMEHTGARIANQIDRFDPALNAIGKVVMAAEGHASPLVALYAHNVRTSLQVEYIASNNPVTDENEREYFSSEILAELDQNARAYEELGAQSVEVEGTAYSDGQPTELGIRSVRIASDAVGFYNRIWQLGSVERVRIRERDGRMVVPLDGYDGTEEFYSLDAGLDKLMVALQEPTVRYGIEGHLNVSLSEVSYGAQTQLLDFMIRANRPTYDRLGEVMHERPKLGSDFLESFLALEQGEEFGDSLLVIAERLSAEDAHEVLGRIGELREVARGIGNSFNGYDPEFGKAVEQAFVRRGTELLAVVEVLAKGELPEAKLYDGTVVAASDLAEVIDAIDVMLAGMRRLNDSLESGNYSLERKDGTTTALRANDGSLLQLRPFGATSKTQDPEHHFDNEARVNFLAGLNGEAVPEGRWETGREQALSIRIDREGIWRDDQGRPMRDEAGLLINEPAGNYGEVSVDIGSIYGDPSNVNVRVGKLLSIGNSLMAVRRGERPNFNHVREVFDRRFGQAVEFARMVESVEQHAVRHNALDQKPAA